MGNLGLSVQSAVVASGDRMRELTPPPIFGILLSMSRGTQTVGKNKSDSLQGSLALLVLKSLEQGPMHGWGITLHIQKISNEVLRIEEGSLYPALHRMEQEGWVVSEWGTSENNRRARFYRLTAFGRRQLNTERENWQKVTNAVALVLDFGKA
jgi:PadR family transcriptional regulator PadR